MMMILGRPRGLQQGALEARGELINVLVHTISHDLTRSGNQAIELDQLVLLLSLEVAL